MIVRDLTILIGMCALLVGGNASSETKAGPTVPSRDDSDLFLVNDGGLEIRRPNKSWKFSTDTSEPGVVATITSPDSVATVKISAQNLPGFELQILRLMVENTHAVQVQSFVKLEGHDRKLNGIDVYEYLCSMKRDDVRRKAKILICKLDDTMYVVECETTSAHWDRFEKDFSKILASLRAATK